MKTYYWITKDKRKIKVQDLSTEHLRNILRMLERQAQQQYAAEVEACGVGLDTLQGEMALYYAEAEFDELLATDPVDWLRRNKYYQILKQELNRRGKE